MSKTISQIELEQGWTVDLGETKKKNKVLTILALAIVFGLLALAASHSIEVATGIQQFQIYSTDYWIFTDPEVQGPFNPQFLESFHQCIETAKINKGSLNFALDNLIDQCEILDACVADGDITNWVSSPAVEACR